MFFFLVTLSLQGVTFSIWKFMYLFSDSQYGPKNEPGIIWLQETYTHLYFTVTEFYWKDTRESQGNKAFARYLESRWSKSHQTATLNLSLHSHILSVLLPACLPCSWHVFWKRLFCLNSAISIAFITLINLKSSSRLLSSAVVTTNWLNILTPNAWERQTHTETHTQGERQRQRDPNLNAVATLNPIMANREGSVYLPSRVKFFSRDLTGDKFFFSWLRNLNFIFFLIFFFLFVVVFVIHWNETAMGLHVFPIPIPPPTSLSTRSF